MAINWRELLPHYVAMLAIYVIVVYALGAIAGIDSFWASLAVALVVAFGYPQVAREMGFAPPSWER